MFFQGQCGVPGAKELRKTKAPPKCKFFVWVALMGRCWTADRRCRHGLQDSVTCALCSQGTETIHHLLLACVFSREFWFLLLRRVGMQRFTPSSNELELANWWTRCRKQVQKDRRKGLGALVVLGYWMMWLERNAWVFNRTLQ
jgi:hypothetical protein